ncbi:MAG TPA: VOC family protein [Candidatus Saccharibacteria bacterium]|nr:VOC family protein [Candidatus Saccharibacteria bacterium]HRK94549.1 VOC family protein [Candidatus Saccharibacteria bacterium]
MATVQKITPCLWFGTQAEEAANFYCEVFGGDSKVTRITHYPEEGLADFQKDFAGKVLTVEFELAGQKFMALNGGPIFKFNEAISLMVDCADQAEIDYFWEKLSHVPESEQCGWCKDKYGLSWQITPEQRMAELNSKQFAAFMQMKKVDIAALEAAK